MKIAMNKLNWKIARKRFNKLTSKVRKTIATIGWVIGFCIACNKDANYINFIGVGLFFISSLMISQEAE